MTTTQIETVKEGLTATGMGRVLRWDRDDPLPAAAIAEITMTRGAVVIPEVAFDEEEFRTFVAGLGSKVSYEDEHAQVGYGFGDLLHLDGNEDEGKVITGRGPIPLHTDGVLLERQVDMIILFAKQLEKGSDEGATTVCDQLTAWEEMPEELRSVLEERELEYLAEERGYFTTVPEDWYTISPFRDYGRVRSLNLALPFAEGVACSWDVRVKGMQEEESRAFFAALGEYLGDPRYLYRHEWSEGDLLLIDNQRTLHGREGIREGSVRKLYRGQVTIEG
jgi:(5R)-carbapenem-3-carboxylate synthase